MNQDLLRASPAAPGAASDFRSRRVPRLLHGATFLFCGLFALSFQSRGQAEALKLTQEK